MNGACRRPNLRILHPESRVESRGLQERHVMRANLGRGHWRGLCAFVPVLALTALCGCASTRPATSDTRRFDFQRDTFAYANGLVWDYGYDTNGVWRSHKRVPRPDYTQHCFVVARAAKQFFENARFDPLQPVAEETTYRRLIRRVVSTSPRRQLPEPE